MKRLITEDWLVAWPTDCPSLIDEVLSLPQLRAGAVMWLTGGVPNIERLWTVCLQHSCHTSIEQRGYARLGDHDEGLYPPALVQQHAERHSFQWSLSLRGSLGLDCAQMLRAAGAWAIRGEPIRYEEMLDGIWFFVAAWRRGWGSCRFLSSSGAIYRGRVHSAAIEESVGGWCRRSSGQFQRAARWQQWLGWLPIAPWSSLWRHA